MKKQILVATTAIFIMFIALIALVSVTYALDEESTLDISKYLSSQISQHESEQFVNTETDDSSGAKVLQLLNNLDDQPEYLLVTDITSYTVYNRVTGDLLEKNNGESPYSGVNTGYYVGPAGYYKKQNNDIVDVKTSKIINSQNKTKFKKQNKKITQRMIKAKKDSLNLLPESNLPPMELVQYPHIALKDFTMVEAYAPITSWLQDADFGDNSYGSCTTVAMTIMLRYHDYITGGIVPSTIPDMWANATPRTLQYNCIYSQTGVILSSDTTPPIHVNKSDTVPEGLHKYLILKSGATSLGLTYEKMDTAYSRYCAEVSNKGCINLSYQRQNYTTIASGYQKIESKIGSDYPVQITIYSGGESAKAAEPYATPSLHSVVAYGYLNNSQGQYVRVHLGWETFASVILNKEYLVSDSAIYTLSATKNSVHNVTVMGDTHSCARTGCYSNNKTHEYYNYDGISHKCSCGKTVNHTDFQGISTAANSLHKCKTCGYEANHIYGEDNYTDSTHYCSICESNASHNYLQESINNLPIHGCASQCGFIPKPCTLLDSTTSQYNGLYHEKLCSVCRKWAKVPHSGNATSNGGSGHTVVCAECGLSDTFSHDYGYVYYDSGQHRYQCITCGQHSFFGSLSSHKWEIYLLFFFKCKDCGQTRLR